MAHAHAIVADRIVRPRDPEIDIASALLAAEVESRKLDQELIAGVLRILISAGHNSTTNALGNVVLYLAENRDARICCDASPTAFPARWRNCCAGQARCRSCRAMPRKTSRSAGARSRQAIAWACYGVQAIATKPSSPSLTAASSTANQTAILPLAMASTPASAPPWRGWNCV
jgi:hypothetical protein